MPRDNICEVCFDYFDANQMCTACNRCGGCCACYTKVKFFNGKLKFYKATKAQHKFNHTNRFIAAEIEVGQVIVLLPKYIKKIENTVRKWSGSIVRDGSLPGRGFEINTSPAAGDVFNKQINEICKVLNEAKAKITPECGLHVHLDARDFNFNDISRLVRVYSVIEPALFLMVPASRRNSRFCLKCGDKYNGIILANGKLTHKDLKEKIVSNTYNDADTYGRINYKYDQARYNALNIHSWFYRGTIEYRLFNGTTNPDDIINWGVMWAKILDYCLHSPDERVITEMNKAEPLGSLLKIVDNKKLSAFIEQRYNDYKDK